MDSREWIQIWDQPTIKRLTTRSGALNPEVHVWCDLTNIRPTYYKLSQTVVLYFNNREDKIIFMMAHNLTTECTGNDVGGTDG